MRRVDTANRDEVLDGRRATRRPSRTSSPGAATENATIRPFHVSVPEAELEDLGARIAATRWPEKETVEDASQGVQLATMQALARYWLDEYDWRECEVRLNAVPQFVTEIDGLDIHFVHVRSKHENALPLVVSHGWPGSVIEQMKIVDLLTDPTAHGGSASDAFVAVGGDWGGIVVDVMAAGQAPPELVGIHSTFPGVFPAAIEQAIQTRSEL